MKLSDKEIVKSLKKLLPDGLYKSKDYNSGDLIERVEWLIVMYATKKDELEILEDIHYNGDNSN